VIVNGQVALRDGQRTINAGKALRSSEAHPARRRAAACFRDCRRRHDVAILGSCTAIRVVEASERFAQ